MPLYHSDAFVLRTYKLGDADQIVVLFTQDFGKLRVVIRRRNARGPRRHMTPYYEPLVLLHAIVFGRPTQALHRMNSIDIIQPFRVLREDFDLLRCGLYMTELLDVTTQDRAPAPELFALFHQALEGLAPAPVPMLHVRLFEIHLLMAIGYTPQLSECARCSGDLSEDVRMFSPRFGGLLCPSCAAQARHALTVAQGTLHYLRLAIAGEPLSTTIPDDAVQQELEHLLHTHLTTCLGRELKSYAFLHL